MAYTEKYLSVTGGGAHDGSSEANAWTWAEFLTNRASGDRANIKSGTYTIPDGDNIAAGTEAICNALRGYNSTIGDLDTQGRNADTTLNTTNFPEFQLSGKLNLDSYVAMQNLKITGTYAGDMIGDGNNDYTWVFNCYLENDADSIIQNIIRCDDGLILVNCDLYTGTGSFGYIARGDYQNVFIGCRFVALGTTSSYMFRINGATFEGCAVFGNENDVINIGNTLDSTVLINNTFYDCGDILRMPNATQTNRPILVNNHVTDGDRWLNNLYSATSNIAVFEAFTRIRDITTQRTGIGDGILAGELTTDTGGASTDYVDAPNGDITLIAAAPAVDAGMGM